MGARWLETDTLSNQDISSALAVGAYTADADRLILVQVFADQVAGNGDYDIYLTHRINGAGSSYRLIPITTAAAASGVTAIAAQSGMIAVRSGDVLTVYLDGLAGDNANPDTIVRWFELAALQPATPGQTIALDGDGYVTAASVTGDVGGKVLGGGAGEITDIGAWAELQDYDDLAVAVRAELATELARIDIPISESWDEVRSGHTAEGTFGAVSEYIATSAQNASAVRFNLTTELARIDAAITSRAATGAAMTLATGAVTAAAIATGAIDADALATDAVSEIAGAITGVAGSGAVTHTITINDGVSPLDGVEVWITTDVGGTNVVAGTLTTDAFGRVTFYLDAGGYYAWMKLSGYTFTNPTAITVTA